MPHRARVLSFVDPRRQKARAEEAAELRRAWQMVLPLLPKEQQLVGERAVARVAGELEDGQPGWGEDGFVMVSRRHLPRLIELADETGRPVAALKVILASLVRLERDQTTIAASRAELAEDCKITPQEVSAVMHELAAAGVVSVEKVGRRVAYRFNPVIAWRGKETPRTAARQDFEPPRLA